MPIICLGFHFSQQPAHFKYHLYEIKGSCLTTWLLSHIFICRLEALPPKPYEVRPPVVAGCFWISVLRSTGSTCCFHYGAWKAAWFGRYLIYLRRKAGALQSPGDAAPFNHNLCLHLFPFCYFHQVYELPSRECTCTLAVGYGCRWRNLQGWVEVTSAWLHFFSTSSKSPFRVRGGKFLENHLWKMQATCLLMASIRGCT